MTNEEINANWAELKESVAKLQRNREQVPMEDLQTKYATGYRALVAKIWKLGEWWADCCVQAAPFPFTPGSDHEKEFTKRAGAVLWKEKAQPGGLYEQMKATLIDDMDLVKFMDLALDVYEKVYYEAFQPYWDSNCRWVGPPENRWIKSDVTGHFWNPQKKCWYTKEGKKLDCCFPPSDSLTDPEAQIRMEELT